MQVGRIVVNYCLDGLGRPVGDENSTRLYSNSRRQSFCDGSVLRRVSFEHLRDEPWVVLRVRVEVRPEKIGGKWIR